MRDKIERHLHDWFAFRGEPRTRELIESHIGKIIANNPWLITGQRSALVGEPFWKSSEIVEKMGWTSAGSTLYATPEKEIVALTRAQNLRGASGLRIYFIDEKDWNENRILARYNITLLLKGDEFCQVT